MAIVLQMERGSLQLPPASIASLSLTSIYSFNVLRRSQSRSSLFGCVDDDEHTPRVGKHAFCDPIRWLTLAQRALSRLWHRRVIRRQQPTTRLVPTLPLILVTSPFGEQTLNTMGYSDQMPQRLDRAECPKKDRAFLEAPNLVRALVELNTRESGIPGITAVSANCRRGG